MPRYNVNHNDKWACFSSIVDNFITPFMSVEDYENWRTDEYGRNKTALEKTNQIELEGALMIIKSVHGDERYEELKNEIEKVEY